MKKLFYIIVILLPFSGCNDEDTPMSDAIGEWELIQSHQYIGTEIIKEGEDLEWNEVYVFRTNGTFQKYRTFDTGVTSASSASGKFISEEAPLYLARPVKLMLKLTFKTGVDLAVGCNPGQEEIELSSHDGLLRNYSISCENPIFSYKKK